MMLCRAIVCSPSPFACAVDEEAVLIVFSKTGTGPKKQWIKVRSASVSLLIVVVWLLFQDTFCAAGICGF